LEEWADLEDEPNAGSEVVMRHLPALRPRSVGCFASPRGEEAENRRLRFGGPTSGRRGSGCGEVDVRGIGGWIGSRGKETHIGEKLVGVAVVGCGRRWWRH
jgi:hypothetical protein